eukprot:TRINITY_DN7324_c0_g1_i1.p1 TRINITY_DN7324_c0_g1~~TRINITY_DN7324_c0_g1_i1.p1  ORF type:complete len:399 (-),score=133.79 TRINITY_DN7324_c0_g1_i1:56-1252(-)
MVLAFVFTMFNKYPNFGNNKEKERELEERGRLLEEKIAAMQSMYDLDREKLMAGAEQYKEQLEMYKAQIERVRNAYKQELSVIMGRYEKDRERLESLTIRVGDLSRENDKLKKNLAKMIAIGKHEKQKNAALREENDGLLQRIAELEARIKELEEENSELRKALEAKEQENMELSQQLDTTTSELNTKTQELEQEKQENQSLVEKVAELEKEIQEKHEEAEEREKAWEAKFAQQASELVTVNETQESSNSMLNELYYGIHEEKMGMLQKKGPNASGLQKRFFMCRGGTLSYFKDVRQFYKPLGQFFLPTCEIEDLEESVSMKKCGKQGKYGFAIHINERDDQKVYYVCAETQQIKDDWLAYLAKTKEAFSNLDQWGRLIEPGNDKATPDMDAYAAQLE